MTASIAAKNGIQTISTATSPVTIWAARHHVRGFSGSSTWGAMGWSAGGGPSSSWLLPGNRSSGVLAPERDGIDRVLARRQRPSGRELEVGDAAPVGPGGADQRPAARRAHTDTALGAEATGALAVSSSRTSKRSTRSMLGAGDHLTQQPCQERLRAQQDQHDAEQQQRAVAQGLAEGQFHHRQVGQHGEARQERDRAEPAEERHRAAREPRQVQDRDQVQEPSEVALEPELGHAVDAGPVVHDLLLDAAVALPLGQQRDVAVQLAVDPDGFHDLAAVRLDARVEVMQRDARHPAGDLVEELGRDALFPRVVAPTLPPAHQIGAGVQARHHLGQLRRVVLQVGVERGNAAPAGPLEPDRQRGALAVVPPEADAREPRVLAMYPLDDAPRAVVRAVVHHPHLERQPVRVHRLADLVRQRGQALGLVVDRDDDGEVGAHGVEPSAARRRPRLERDGNWGVADQHEAARSPSWPKNRTRPSRSQIQTSCAPLAR